MDRQVCCHFGYGGDDAEDERCYNAIPSKDKDWATFREDRTGTDEKTMKN